MAVCIDSHIFIWGIKKVAEASQQDMIARAQAFFEHLDEEGHQIIIPAPVLMEVLSPEPLDVQEKMMTVITRSFIVAPFDAFAAQKAAELMQRRSPEIKEYRQLNQVRRDKMKFDFAIVATALANEASCIFSYDDHVVKAADGLIPVREIPEMRIQTTVSHGLFGTSPKWRVWSEKKGEYVDEVATTGDDLPF